jgi:hypothetical protein
VVICAEMGARRRGAAIRRHYQSRVYRARSGGRNGERFRGGQADRGGPELLPVQSLSANGRRPWTSIPSIDIRPICRPRRWSPFSCRVRTR